MIRNRPLRTRCIQRYHAWEGSSDPENLHSRLLGGFFYSLVRQQSMRGLANYATVRIAQFRPEIDHSPISSSFDSPSSPEVFDIAVTHCGVLVRPVHSVMDHTNRAKYGHQKNVASVDVLLLAFGE
jgi:hypothetical protein